MPAPVILGLDGKPYRPEKPRVKAPSRGSGRVQRYDSAQTTDENRNHWSAADGLSAGAANSAAVRYKLRTRARYEIANNGNAARLVRRRVNDTIGKGPRLQLSLPETYSVPEFPETRLTVAADAGARVEWLWCQWAKAIRLVDKLRVYERGESTDGESFAVEFHNPALPDTAPQLDIRIYECDQVTTPDLFIETETRKDGIVFDDAGNPVEYHFLKFHPGDAVFGANPLDYDRVPAKRVYHLFEELRAGQVRGVPPLTPGLPLYAIMRRLTLAGLLSAEWGACVAGVIEEEGGLPDDGESEADEPEAMDTIPIARNALLYVGAGRKAHAFDSKQPSPEYAAFKAEVLTESGGAVGAPRNVSTGSSAEYNYSSGRLDQLPWQADAGIRREARERLFLERLFRAWYAEAQLIPGYLPDGLPPLDEWRIAWNWDGFPSIDPLKDANANKTKKEAGLLTDAQALAADGIDWRDHYAQLAREKALRKQLGIDEPKPAPAPAQPSAPPAEDPDANTEDEEAAADA